MEKTYLMSVCRDFGLNVPEANAQTENITGSRNDHFSSVDSTFYEALLAQILAVTTSPDLLVLLARKASKSPTHLGYFTVYSAKNLDQAVHRLMKYYPVFEPDHASISYDSDANMVSFDWHGSAQFLDVHATIQMVQLVQMAREATATRITPKIVSFSTAFDPARMTCFQEFFGIDVIFDSGFYMVFDDADMNRDFAPFGHMIWPSIEADMDHQLFLRKRKLPIDRLVQSAIEALLAHGPVSLAGVAADLAIGQRTLQRQLKLNGTSFNDLLDQTRLAMFQPYIRLKSMSRAAIAFRLGFQDANSFYRVYQRWVRDGKLP